MNRLPICFFAFLIAFSSFVHAQDFPPEVFLRVEQVISDNYPDLKAYLSVEDKDGKVIPSLVKGNFAAIIDQEEQKERFDVAGFQYTEAPTSYIVLMTINGLLEGEPIAQQKAAVLNLVDQMRDNDTLSVYLIGEQPQALFENTEKAKIDGALIPGVEADPENISKLFDSVVAMSRKVKDMPHERKVMIILSDGRDQQSRASKEEAVKELATANIPIYTIGIKIMGGLTLGTLDWISQNTGGKYLYSSRHDQIPANMLALSKRLLQSYVLKFSAVGVNADDDMHQLTLIVSNEGTSAKSSKTFLAKKVPIPFWLWMIFLAVAILILAGLIIGFLILRRMRRHQMGITVRRCKTCGKRQKDDWEFCPFCEYLPKKVKSIAT